jgi:hypothetical protein
MSIEARIDTDVVYQDNDGTTLTVGVQSEHLRLTPLYCSSTSGTVGTSAVTLAAPASISTLALKNTGNGVLRVAGMDFAAGRVAVLPVTATITVTAPAAASSYTAVWVG